MDFESERLECYRNVGARGGSATFAVHYVNAKPILRPSEVRSGIADNPAFLDKLFYSTKQTYYVN